MCVRVCVCVCVCIGNKTIEIHETRYTKKSVKKCTVTPVSVDEGDGIF